MLHKYSQHHGKDWENHLKAAFPGSTQSSELCTAIFDIEKRFDDIDNKNTSVKCSKSSTICLSSALRGFAIDEDFRMLFGQYKQVGDTKIFTGVTEYLITANEWKGLMGTCTMKEIDYFHSGLKDFSLEDYKPARAWAKIMKAAFKVKHPTLKFNLNAKIGSHDNQRRLQLSISKEILDQHVAKRNFFATSYKGVTFPIVIDSAAREFKKIKNEQTTQNTQV